MQPLYPPNRGPSTQWEGSCLGPTAVPEVVMRNVPGSLWEFEWFFNYLRRRSNCRRLLEHQM